MRLRRKLVPMLTVAIISLIAACRDASPVGATPEPTPRNLPPLPPDTGTLGLSPVTGRVVMAIVPESLVTDSADRSFIEFRRRQPMTVSLAIGKLTPAWLEPSKVGDTLTFELSPTRRVSFQLSRLSVPFLTNNWFGMGGDLVGGKYGTMLFVFDSIPARKIIGGISIYPGGSTMVRYSITGLRDGLHIIEYIDWRYAGFASD
jgi:hypothetical protein